MSSLPRFALELVGGASLAIEIEAAGATVDLVQRDPAGTVISGIMLTPDEAHRLGQALITNAFAVGSSSRAESKGVTM